MLVVDVCDLLVNVSQLHVVFVHLVVVYHFVYFLDPLVVHEHAVVALRNHLLPTHEFVVLRLHPKTHGLDSRLLLQERLAGAHSAQHVLQFRWIFAYHLLDPPQKTPFREVFFEGIGKDLGGCELVQEEAVEQSDSQGVDVAFVGVVVVVLGEVLSFANVD